MKVDGDGWNDMVDDDDDDGGRGKLRGDMREEC